MLALAVLLKAAVVCVAMSPARRARRDHPSLVRQARVDAWHLESVVAARAVRSVLQRECVLMVRAAAILEHRRHQRSQRRRAAANYRDADFCVRPDDKVDDAVCIPGVSCVRGAGNRRCLIPG